MKTCEAIELLLNRLDDDVVCFFTNGFISRTAFSIKDRVKNFYMLGSMGLVASVGLGVALNTSKKVVIFDGDGSMLMNLGAMPLIGYESPKNYVHVVLDNNCYASTGGQPTVANNIDFLKLARSVGYNSVFSFSNTNDFKGNVSKCLRVRGPVLLHLKVSSDTAAPSSRVSVSPGNLRRRLRKALK